MSAVVLYTSVGIGADGSSVEFAESTVTLVVAVAAFTVVGLMWMATTFGRNGIGLRHRLPAESDTELDGGTDDDQ